MARTARKKADDDSGVVKAKDFELAKKLYFGDAKPAISKAREHMQEASTCYKAIKKEAHIQPGAFKAAMKVVEMEDAKSEDWLRCFNGTLRANNVDPDPKDMVDAMQAGEDRYARPKPDLSLVTLSDGSETDLADAADDFDEATDAELAAQEGRGGGVTEADLSH